MRSLLRYDCDTEPIALSSGFLLSALCELDRPKLPMQPPIRGAWPSFRCLSSKRAMGLPQRAIFPPTSRHLDFASLTRKPNRHTGTPFPLTCSLERCILSRFVNKLPNCSRRKGKATERWPRKAQGLKLRVSQGSRLPKRDIIIGKSSIREPALTESRPGAGFDVQGHLCCAIGQIEPWALAVPGLWARYVSLPTDYVFSFWRWSTERKVPGSKQAIFGGLGAKIWKR